MAIHQALLDNRDNPALHILTDSLGSIQKLLAQLDHPMTTARNHHLHLLRAVAHLFFLRDSRLDFLTSIHKVPAHADIPGNDAADAGAKDVVKAHGAQLPDTVVHRTGAQPHRLPVWAFAKAIPAAVPGAPAPEPHAFTHIRHMRKHAALHLGTHTARPSLYRTLFQ